MADKPARKKRRIRSPHPGVVLLKPDADERQTYWRARFVDPETERVTKVRLDPLALPTAEVRRDWAIRKAKELARQRMYIAAGDVPRFTRQPIGESVEGYFTVADNRLRKTTLDL